MGSQHPRRLLSLGHRCDVAFQLRMHSGDNSAHFFDWLATTPDGAATIIERDFDVFHPDHLQLRRGPADGSGSDCVVDRVTGTIFWHQFPMLHTTIPTEFLIYHPAFRAKFVRLAQRFRETVGRFPVTLVRTEVNEDQALRLERAFMHRFPQADAQFLYVIDKGAAFVTPHGRSTNLAFVDRSLGDPAAWARMLQDAGLITDPYRLSTAEILGHDHDDFNCLPERRFSDAEVLAAIAANPGSGALRAELGWNCLLADQIEQAAEQFELATVLEPARHDWAIERILAQWRLGHLQAAEAVAAIASLPPMGHVQQRHQYLKLLQEDRQFAACRAACNQLLSKHPLDATLYRIKAESCLALDYAREAEAAIDRAIELNPMDWSLQLQRADIMARLGHPFAARKASRRALDLDDNPTTREAFARFKAAAAMMA